MQKSFNGNMVVYNFLDNVSIVKLHIKLADMTQLELIGAGVGLVLFLSALF